MLVAGALAPPPEDPFATAVVAGPAGAMCAPLFAVAHFAALVVSARALVPASRYARAE